MVKQFFSTLWSLYVPHKFISPCFEVFAAVKSGVSETYQLILDSTTNFPFTLHLILFSHVYVFLASL